MRILCIWLMLMLFPMQGMAAETGGKGVEGSAIVHYATGIDPDDYPCARDSLLGLYKKRGELADLNRFHPRRVFQWILDASVYYTGRFLHFLKSLADPDLAARGFHAVNNLVRHGTNPLAGADQAISGWFHEMSPQSNYALQRKMRSIIQNSTNADGSCRL